MVTVGPYSTGGTLVGYGFFDAATDTGALPDTEFTVGSNSYTIDGVWTLRPPFAGSLNFSLTSALAAADLTKLVLHVGSTSLAFSNASGPDSFQNYQWLATGLDWTSEDYVTLRLRDTGANQNVGAVIPKATDDDDDSLTYSMEGTDAASFTFDAAIQQIQTKTALDHEAKSSYSVTVKADDGTASDTIAVTITVTDVDEQPATPAKPTLAAVSATSLTATWVKPGLNGGPDITGYNVNYRVSTVTAWETFTHSGAGVTSTITGLTASTLYQVRVQALNGETPSDWSDPSDAVSTNTEAATAPTVTDVAVTSSPVLDTDTYGAGETIKISVTFSEAVNATDVTDFVLSVGGAKRAPLLRGSGTATLVFGYTVQAGDSDDNGIWIGASGRTLDGDRNGDPQTGAITSVATSAAADLTHNQLGEQSGHKVDGSLSIIQVSVTSTPVLESDTYGAGETIEFTVTFTAAMDVTGDPTFRFALGNSGAAVDKDATYESGSGSTALVFGYTVLSSDMDGNGIYLYDGTDLDNPDGPVRLDSADSIQFTGTSTDVPLAWPSGRAGQFGHKVDGSQTPAAATCTLNTGDGDIWCGVVTVGAYSPGGTDIGYGFVDAATDIGALSDKGFSVGTNSYTIDDVWVGRSTLAGVLNFGLTSDLDAADKAKLVLHVGSAEFAFSAATGPDSAQAYRWVTSGLDWSSTSEVTLRLRETATTTVTIAADHAAFIATVDNVTFTLTRTEDLSAALDVAVVTCPPKTGPVINS